MSCVCVTSNGQGMQPLEGLLRHVSFIVPELPHDLAMDMLRQAYIEFARRSSMLIAEVDVNMQKGVRDYTLEAPCGYDIFAIKNAQFRHSIEPDYFYYPNPDRWYFMFGYRYYIRSNNEIVFWEAPSSDGNKPCTFYVALLPNECVEDIPDEIAGPYGQGLSKKVVADALCIPNKPWTNPALSQKYERDYNRTVMAAKNLMLTNRGTLAPSFKPVRIL